MTTATQHISDAEFTSAISAGGTTLVDFWAPWCGPCRATGSIIDELADEYEGRATIAKMNIEENAATPASLRIQAVPTFILFKDGEAVGKVTGAVSKEQLKDLINTAL